MNSPTIGIVKAAWHAEAVEAFALSCRTALKSAGQPLQISEFSVPGVVEIPLFTKKLIQSGAADVIVVTGLIADHGVYRHEFVASTVLDAIMTLQMETGVPIIYGILTPQDYLSEGREAFFKEHFKGKGLEAASAVLKTLDNDRLLSELVQKAG